MLCLQVGSVNEDRQSDLYSSISESLGLERPKLNELNDSYEIENLVENLKNDNASGCYRSSISTGIGLLCQKYHVVH